MFFDDHSHTFWIWMDAIRLIKTCYPCHIFKEEGEEGAYFLSVEILLKTALNSVE